VINSNIYIFVNIKYIGVMMKICIDGATCSGKSTTIGYLQFMLDNLRTKINIVPEMAWLCLDRLDEDTTFQAQSKIFEMQKAYEKHLSNNGKIDLICDRGALSAIPYIRFAKISNEEKNRLENEILNYVKNYPYDYCIYMEPVNVSEKIRKWQMMLDRETRKIYEQHFIKDINLFYIPPFPAVDNTPAAIKASKIQRGEYVLELLQKLFP
jgi:thymidylate kinase